MILVESAVSTMQIWILVIIVTMMTILTIFFLNVIASDLIVSVINVIIVFMLIVARSWMIVWGIMIIIVSLTMLLRLVSTIGMAVFLSETWLFFELVWHNRFIIELLSVKIVLFTVEMSLRMLAFCQTNQIFKVLRLISISKLPLRLHSIVV